MKIRLAKKIPHAGQRYDTAYSEGQHLAALIAKNHHDGWGFNNVELMAFDLRKAERYK